MILQKHIDLSSSNPDPEVERFMIADEVRDHYLLFSLGWSERKRIRNFSVYVRLKDRKFWIEHDLSEDGIATELLAAGVPNEDIVLAFHAPEMRQYTDFAA
jgi:hypothetical protein